MAAPFRSEQVQCLTRNLVVDVGSSVRSMIMSLAQILMIWKSTELHMQFHILVALVSTRRSFMLIFDVFLLYLAVSFSDMILG